MREIFRRVWLDVNGRSAVIICSGAPMKWTSQILLLEAAESGFFAIEKASFL
jgi:hypothetical protein